MNFQNTISQKDQKFPLKIINIGGTETVTKNMTAYEYKDEIILVDCGMGMPDDEMLGVDIVIPDFTYLLANAHKVKALFITHGHEDHIGAIPYFAQQFDVPIYANKLVQGFITEKFKDRSFKELAQKIRFGLISPDSGPITVGNFTVEAFRVNHSVPHSMGFAIKTPEGTVLHMADYKIDWTPVIDPPIDLGKIAMYGEQGVLALLSDCLGATTEGFSKSEKALGPTFHELFEVAQKRQILVTTISSNISRMYQIIDAANKQGRKVVLAGRSIEQSVSVAQRLGLLPFSPDVFVKEENAGSYPQGSLVYIIAGCYGQQGSALDRVSRHEHDNIELEENALVIFSADPNPPGVDVAVERLMSVLTLAGAEVLYSQIQENLHVSGHGIKGDLTTIAEVVRPKYYIPIGGTITKMRAYSKMIMGLGVERDRIFENKEGDSVEFFNGNAQRGPSLETKPVYISQGSTDQINPIVIKDRGQLSTEGVFVVVIPASHDGKLFAEKAEIVTRGFIYVKGSQELMEKSKKYIVNNVNSNFSKSKDWTTFKKKLESDIGKFLYKETARDPLVIVHSINI